MLLLTHPGLGDETARVAASSGLHRQWSGKDQGFSRLNRLIRIAAGFAWPRPAQAIDGGGDESDVAGAALGRIEFTHLRSANAQALIMKNVASNKEPGEIQVLPTWSLGPAA